MSSRLDRIELDVKRIENERYQKWRREVLTEKLTKAGLKPKDLQASLDVFFGVVWEGRK